jgi:hypothetical protein
MRVAVCAGIALVYVYAFPFFGQLKSANELPRVLTTQEIVDHGTFRLDRRMGELGSTFDVSTTPAHHMYSNKAPGPSLLAVPAYLLCKAFGARSIRACTWAFRVTAVTIPALLFLPLFFRLTRRFSEDERARRTSLVAYALGSMALPYGMLFMSHDIAAAFAGTAFALAVTLCRGETKRPDVTAALCGLAAGTAVLMDYQAVIAALAIGVYVIVRAPRRIRQVALAAAGAILPAIILAAYHTAAFGSPLATGYKYAADPANHQGLMGIIGPNREAMANALVAPSNGLLVLMPWVLLAIVGGVVIARDRAWRERAGAEAIVCGAVIFLYVLFLGSLVPEFGRAGWAVGPRYITVALPFAAWLGTAGFATAERHVVSRVAAQATVFAGVIIYLIVATTYPHWPEYLKNPLYEISLRALARGLTVHSIGTAIGLHGVWAALPMYLVAAALAIGLIGWGGGRDRWITTGIACVFAIGLVVSYRALPGDKASADKAWRFIDRTWEPSNMKR